MRTWPVLAICAVISACSGSPEPAPANATPAAVVTPPLIDIPRSPNQLGSKLERGGKLEHLDLDAIADRGYLRVLVARSDLHFYTYEDAHSGKAVDTGVALARVLSVKTGKRVTPVFIETGEVDLIPQLLTGKGDVAANLLLTFARDEQVAFAPPVRTGIREQIVTAASAPLVSLEDVGTRTVHVRQDSDHHTSMLRLNEQLRSIDRPIARIVLAQPNVTDGRLMERVNRGEIPATIVFDYELRTLPNIHVNRDVAVSQDGSLSWVSRKDAPKLAEFMKEFFTTHKLTF